MAALLANAQAGKGHDVKILYSRRPETPSNLADFFDLGVGLVQIQMNTPIEKARSIFALRRALQGLAPDAVFMHSSFAGFLGRLAALLTLKQTLFFYLPHCISFMRQDIGLIKKASFIALEWIGSIKSSRYIACSTSEQTAIKATIPFRTCHLVENALDFSAIPLNLPTPRKGSQKTLITVGQIRPQKNPEQFAQLAQTVKRIRPDVAFTWVGDGDPMLRRGLETAGVHVTGWTPKDKVWELLKDSDVYLSTARWEGMPVSVIEAISMGLPVIASNCAGNIDVIEHNTTGWLFETTDQALSIIQQVLDDLEATHNVAQHALALAHQRFSVERYFIQMEHLTHNQRELT